ncbi:MAG: response regulator transcription factor [Candidatus Izemoplasmatales bacterium]|jgi:two-component system KDP operon response regulator KdpE|nr:response regulator transcription factor [Candidatus Izemoplasmatales bacterium]MDD4355460.1 response regulator transcription factor [Candidatus Izemoplasmatales bacterium]MDD4987822.1 response regulator transcription factor [Candidatus Izemoplasmatales bacterium]MDY0372659.1 response regulator transcription factor [Candidatus Izemoplasmatales bacterium]NLF49081.1 response regulator transcription factor [Acholeplasmataceae bacterium]
MDEKGKILIIEDDKYISGFIAVSLKKNGYLAYVAETGAQGLFLYSNHHPDIILLDLGLPDMDGIDLLKEFRTFSQVPIIVVSARAHEQEKVSALDQGADDYLTKPFFMGELLARIRVSERKKNQVAGQGPEPIFQSDWLSVDFEKRRVSIEGEEVHLTPIEYKLLTTLIHHQGKVLTHLFLLREVWGYEEGSDTKTVRVFMANLRRKIEKDTMKPRFILTEVGVGYRFADD